MGSIKRFHLSRIKEEYNCDYFFETGTWKGDGVAHAQKIGFKRIYSSEIIPEIADRAKKRFAHDKSIEILLGNSTEVLRNTLGSIPGNCIFWLDAHFPGAEEGLEQYNAFEDESVKLPLEEEILAIKAIRPGFRDVILIDDLRIYETGPFDSGNLPDGILPPKVRTTEFINKIFSSTHTIVKSYRDEGYIMVVDSETYRSVLSKRTILDKLSDRIQGRIF